MVPLFPTIHCGKLTIERVPVLIASDMYGMCWNVLEFDQIVPYIYFSLYPWVRGRLPTIQGRTRISKLFLLRG